MRSGIIITLGFWFAVSGFAQSLPASEQAQPVPVVGTDEILPRYVPEFIPAPPLEPPLLLAYPPKPVVEKKPNYVFHNESELGIVVSHGNTNAQTINAIQMNSYQWDQNSVKAQYHFYRSETDNLEQGRHWEAQLRYDREITPKFGLFLAQGVEVDPYAGFDSRSNSEIGAKITLADVHPWSWIVEPGYRYSAERRTEADDTYSHVGRLNTEVNTKWTRTFSSRLLVEYLPNFTAQKEFRINSEISASLMLTQILSLKTAYSMRYNNYPPRDDVKRTDTLLTTSLVAKF